MINPIADVKDFEAAQATARAIRSLVHIYCPPGTYQARVRRHGCRRYELVGKKTKSYAKALKNLAAAFAAGRYKRGDILWVTDCGYHEPHRVCELVKD